MRICAQLDSASKTVAADKPLEGHMDLGGTGSAGLGRLDSWVGSLHMSIDLREVDEADQELKVAGSVQNVLLAHGSVVGREEEGMVMVVVHFQTVGLGSRVE